MFYKVLYAKVKPINTNRAHPKNTCKGVKNQLNEVKKSLHIQGAPESNLFNEDAMFRALIGPSLEGQTKPNAGRFLQISMNQTELN